MKTLTRQQLAERMNGNECRDEISDELETLAKENNLVVIFGASDDLVELRGAINDECGAGIFYLDRNGLIQNECGDEDCIYYREKLEEGLKSGKIIEVKAWWCGECEGETLEDSIFDPIGKPNWCYTSIGILLKHSPFRIMEDNECYCLGMAIDLDEIFN